METPPNRNVRGVTIVIHTLRFALAVAGVGGGALLPVMSADLKFHPSAWGGMVLVFGAAFMLGLVWVRRLAGRLSHLTLLLIASAGFGVSMALWGLASSLLWIGAGMALFGLLAAYHEIGANALLMRMNPGRITSAMSLLNATYCMGALLTPMAAGWWLARGGSWRLFPLGIAITFLFCTVALWIFNRSAKTVAPAPETAPPVGPTLRTCFKSPSWTFKTQRQRGQSPLGVAKTSTFSKFRSSDAAIHDRKSLFKSHPVSHGAISEQALRGGPKPPLLLWLGVVFVLYLATEQTLNNWATVVLKHKFTMSPADAARLLSGFWGLMWLGRLSTGPLAKRFGEGKVLAMAAAGSMAAPVVLSTAPTPLLAVGALAVTGFFMGPVVPLALGLGAKMDPERMDETNGFLFFCGAVGLLIGPPGVGQATRLLGFPSALYISLGINLLLLVAALGVKRQFEKK